MGSWSFWLVWSGLLYETANWLVDEGLLGWQGCRVRLGSFWLASVDSVPVDTTEGSGLDCRALSDGMYLYTESNQRSLLDNSWALLRNFGLDPGRFQVKPFNS